MTARSAASGKCPHCGEPLDSHAATDAGNAPAAPGGDLQVRYDLEQLAALAASEKAYDETVKVRVTQDDIRKLVEKRRRKAK